jgi:DNA topoisomerase I
LTTITPDHVELGGRATTFEFNGKGGVEHRVKINDLRIARIVRRCHELGGQALFSYRADNGDTVSSVTSQDVNEYLRSVAGTSITAKDFRTWGGTTAAAEHLGPLEPPSTSDEADEHVVSTSDEADEHVVDAIDAAAHQLRNTRAVCRSCYVHPTVLDAYRNGSLTA